MKQMVPFPGQEGRLSTLSKADTSISKDIFITESETSIFLAS